MKASLQTRDGQHVSPWQKTALPQPGSKPFTGIADVLIIGAGITGMTTGLLLQRAGKQCVIAEAHQAGFGTTGGTSAHLNTFFDATYPEIDKAFGKEASKKVAESGKQAFDMIAGFVEELAIDCDYTLKKGYLFAENYQESKQLHDIYSSSLAAGIHVMQTENIPAPMNFQEALAFDGQAQFHPLKYLAALTQAYIDAGGILLENTMVRNVSADDDVQVAETDNGELRGRQLVWATHIPPGINSFSFRCAPYRSYVIGVRLNDDAYPSDLVYDMKEPYHYLRTHVIDGKRYLIAGGEDHKTGHDDPEKAFERVEKYIRTHYNVASVDFRWSSQYYTPVDLLPYIGLMPGENNVFVATGFNGNGMTFGTLSGRIISDIILRKENPWTDLYDPARLKPIAGFSEFVKENADVAYHFVADRFGIKEKESFGRVKPGTGEVVEIDGGKLAVYKDESGTVHALKPVCTHAGCIVNFNSEEKTWDCPCHGGRFSIDGQVLTGPPTKNLEKVGLA